MAYMRGDKFAVPCDNCHEREHLGRTIAEAERAQKQCRTQKFRSRIPEPSREVKQIVVR